METKALSDVTKEDRLKMIEGLMLFSQVQAHLQKEYGFDFWKKPMAERKHWVAEQMMAMISEIGETWEITNKWWKKNAPDFEDAEARKKIVEELVDMYHFFLSLMLTLQITPEEFVSVYLEKMGVNIKRQETNYSYK